MDDFLPQRGLIDIAATCIPVIVMTLAIFLVSITIVLLPEARQHAALKVIDRLNTVVLTLIGKATTSGRRAITR
ncbi:hypothetical protein ACIA8G_35460 [Lentzea sp. NPDC051213]|uniref:hypothetical protein n=1 Tax=Lentzea sp. NPDC051213 TaxID=3364126 RepID=UPI0037BA24C8